MKQGAWIVATVETETDFRVVSQEPFTSVEGFAETVNIQRFDVSHDDDRLLAIRELEESDPRVVVTLNFFEELKAKVGN